MADCQLVPMRRIRAMRRDLFSISVGEGTVTRARKLCEESLGGFLEKLGQLWAERLKKLLFEAKSDPAARSPRR